MPCLLTITLFWGVNYPCIYPVLSSKEGLKDEPNAILFLAAIPSHSRGVKDHFQATGEIQSFQGSVCLSFGSPSRWSYLFYFHREKPEHHPRQFGLALLSCSTYKPSWICEHLEHLFQGLCPLSAEKCQTGSSNLCSYLRTEIRLDRQTKGSKPRALLPYESGLNFASKGLALMPNRLAVNVQVFNTHVKLLDLLPALRKLHQLSETNCWKKVSPADTVQKFQFGWR